MIKKKILWTLYWVIMIPLYLACVYKIYLWVQYFMLRH